MQLGTLSRNRNLSSEMYLVLLTQNLTLHLSSTATANLKHNN